MIGLWKACINYEEQRSNFSTYATACILNEIRMELRNRAKEKKKGVMISLDERIVNQEDGCDMTALINMIPDDRDYYCAADYDLSCLRKKLSQRNWRIFELCMQEFSGTDIAKIVGISRGRVFEILKVIRAAAKTKLLPS